MRKVTTSARRADDSTRAGKGNSLRECWLTDASRDARDDASKPGAADCQSQPPQLSVFAPHALHVILPIKLTHDKYFFAILRSHAPSNRLFIAHDFFGSLSVRAQEFPIVVGEGWLIGRIG